MPVSGPRVIRPSQPSVAANDYPELVAVDPAHYAPIRELGRGGMGRIQLARDRRLGRDVAVKELLGSSDVLARRFEREARITARLSHPSIVSVHEAGRWPTGEPFYAMRVVAGRSLDEAIAAAASFEQRLALLPNVLAVADAMAYAHGQQVIHRDLKPRNVLVGEFGETVVIDWGLAKELDATVSLPPSSEPRAEVAATASSPGETTAGDVLGTPAYMPPEQAAGDQVDERADVYAIGALLYHVLAGEPPYTGATSQDVLRELRAGAPKSIASRAPNAPQELVAIVERAMARERAGRYPTARELAEDLRRFQTGQLVGAHRYSLRQLLRRWVRRHRTAIAAVGAAAIVAIVVGVIALQRIVAANRLVEEQRAIAVRNQKGAEQLMGFMLGDLGEKLRRVGRLDIMDAVAHKAADYYDARGATGSDDDLYYSALARRDLAKVFDSRGDLAGEHDQFAKAREILATLVARRPDVARYRLELDNVEFHLAEEQMRHGDLPGALAALRTSVDDAERVYAGHADPEKAVAMIAYGRGDIAWVLEHQGDAASALAEYRRSLTLLSSVSETDEIDKQLLNTHASVGKLLLTASHDDDAALAEFRAGLAIGERQLARDPDNALSIEDVAISHKEIGQVLAANKDYAGALAEDRVALGLAQKLVALEPSSSAHKDTVSVIEEQLGIVLFAQKDPAGALEHFQRAYEFDVQRAAAQPDNLDAQRDVSVMLNKLGDVQVAAKDPTSAIDSYRRALAIREQLVAKAPTSAAWRRDLFYSHYKLAAALDEAPGRKDDAVAELRVALAVAEDNAARSPTSHAAQDDVAGTHDALGDLLAEHHDVAGARAEYHAALDIARREAALPGASPDWTELAAKLTKKLAALGDR